VPTEKDHFREFFHGLNIKETWNKAETDAEVTYSDHESAFKITGLHYHSEDLWDSKLDRVVHRSRVLDWRKHKSWPEGYNNTDEIIQDMVSRCDGQKEACLSFLRQLLSMSTLPLSTECRGVIGRTSSIITTGKT